ncbi:MAG: serine/threonine-protein kinase PknK, partial [Deltaproteobacteria bacterium]|nr:serine/threonine-protein kinase PknK [Deltaproteobacteria bacterium]
MRRITKLGEGLGGVVSLVEAKGQRVALKQLNIDQGKLTPEEVLENFKREFTTLKRLNHPHIVRIIDFGRDDEGRYFFTSEYIEGKNIFEATREWSPEEVNLLFIQVLRALGYLHRERIYHFDIKPQNILVTVSTSGEKIAKLIDFGLVAFRKEGILAGTPAYMAPENLLGGGSDGRADLYSLGITWYECLAGQNPFRTANLMETLERQRHWTPLPISQQYSDIPSYLDPIFEKILRKNPSERYHTAHQVIRDLNWLGQKNYPLETEATALAYIPGEGRLIGREIEWKNLLHFYGQIFQSHTIPQGGLFITGEIGTGKSRLLSELKYHAQLQGVQVLPLTEVKREDIRGDTL